MTVCNVAVCVCTEHGELGEGGITHPGRALMAQGEQGKPKKVQTEGSQVNTEQRTGKKQKTGDQKGRNKPSGTWRERGLVGLSLLSGAVQKLPCSTEASGTGPDHITVPIPELGRGVLRALDPPGDLWQQGIVPPWLTERSIAVTDPRPKHQPGRSPGAAQKAGPWLWKQSGAEALVCQN